MAADQSDRTDKGKESTTGAASDRARDVKDQAKSARDRVASEARSVTERTRERVKTTVNQQKDRAAEGLYGVAEAFRKTGESMRDDEHEQVATYADRIADQVENVSSYLQNKDAGEFVHDLENFARRQPAIFLGGAVALGMMAARFLKSSSSQQGFKQKGQNQGAQRQGTQSGRAMTGSSSTPESRPGAK